MTDESAKIGGVKLHAATDRGLAMLAGPRPLSEALGRQGGILREEEGFSLPFTRVRVDSDTHDQ
jgi:hypothetical protein